MINNFIESVVEDAALVWLAGQGYAVPHGPDISPDGDTLTPALSRRERGSYAQVVLERRLRQALVRVCSGEIRRRRAGWCRGW